MERREQTMGKGAKRWMTARFGIADEVVQKPNVNQESESLVQPSIINEKRGGQSVVIFKSGAVSAEEGRMVKGRIPF